MAGNTHNGARLTWNANSETDLSSYTMLFGQHPTLFGQIVSSSPAFTTLFFPYSIFNGDGVWYFAVEAIDTSGNISPLSNTVSKRIIRTEGQLVVRR